ncbi:membrane protein [Streptococcus porcinus]|nr:membrane protein [Streptococcus porcinus]
MNGLSVALFPLIIGVMTSLIGLAIAINRQYAYSKSQYILFDQLQNGNYTGASDIIDKSVSLTKGYKWKNFLLHLSFLGWFILLLLSFGLLIIYLYPYLITSELYFYEDLKASKEVVK